MFGTALSNDLKKAELFGNLLKSIDLHFGAETDYRRYQNDPAGFGRNILGAEFTEEVKALMESVRDYPITIARSANATGKTHAAARIAIWFYKTFPDSQVYTSAAPPESNLKNSAMGRDQALSSGT